MSASPKHVEKIMSMKLGDFQRGIDSLGFDYTCLNPGHGARIEQNDFKVEIRFEEMDTRTYGTLLTIPRARIMLDFEGTSPQAQKKFIKRFDFYFQKGGG